MSDSPARIALLRAVNVGGRSMPMAELRAMVTDLGFTDVRTLLQSGNLVFRGRGADDAVEARLEAASEQRFGYPADYFVSMRGTRSSPPIRLPTRPGMIRRGWWWWR